MKYSHEQITTADSHYISINEKRYPLSLLELNSRIAVSKSIIMRSKAGL